MPIFKCTLIFNAGKQGWSETWYRDEPDMFAAMKSMKERYADARADLLGSGAFIEAIRVSAEGDPGHSLLEVDPIPGAAEAELNPVLMRDKVWNGWQCLIQAGTHHRRSLVLRGLPDQWIEVGPKNKAAKHPQFLAKFNVWKAAVENNEFLMKVLSKDPIGNPARDVIEIADGNNATTVLTLAGGVYAPGDIIHVTGFKFDRLKDLNGYHPIIDVNGQQVRVPVFIPPNLHAAYMGGAKARKRVYDYVDITRVTAVRAGKRDTGRAFFVPRGRR